MIKESIVILNSKNKKPFVSFIGKFLILALLRINAYIPFNDIRYFIIFLKNNKKYFPWGKPLKMEPGFGIFIKV